MVKLAEKKTLIIHLKNVKDYIIKSQIQFKSQTELSNSNGTMHSDLITNLENEFIHLKFLLLKQK